MQLIKKRQLYTAKAVVHLLQKGQKITVQKEHSEMVRELPVLRLFKQDIKIIVPPLERDSCAQQMQHNVKQILLF